MFQNLFHKNQNNSKHDVFLSPDQLFDRKGFEVNPNDFWKYNTAQLEEAAKKQEAFIKKVRQQYSQQFDELQIFFMKMTEIEKERKSNYQRIEELQLQSESLKSQRDILQRNLADISRTDENQSQQRLQEQLERMQNQCQLLSEENSRLQEENDNITTALDVEKSHRQNSVNQKQIQLDEAQRQLKNSENQLEYLTDQYQKLQEENQRLRIQLDQVSISSSKEIQTEIKKKEEDYVLMMKEFENKERTLTIKLDQKTKDFTRLEAQNKDLQQQIEKLFDKNTNLESQIKTSEVKHKRFKDQLHEQKNRQKELLQTQSDLKIQHNNDVMTLNKQIEDQEQKILLLEAQIADLSSNSISSMDFQKREAEILELHENIQRLQLEKHKLQEDFDEVSSQVRQKDQLNKQLQQKREFAIDEIKKLTQELNSQQALIQQIDQKIRLKQYQDIQGLISRGKLDESMNDSLNSSHSTPSQRNQTQSIPDETQEILVFPTLIKMVNDLKKLLESTYKEYIVVMVGINDKDKTLTQQLNSVEKKITSCTRKCLDFIEFFEDIGIM